MEGEGMDGVSEKPPFQWGWGQHFSKASLHHIIDFREVLISTKNPLRPAYNI